MHCTGCHCRPVYFHETIGKAWYAFLPLPLRHYLTPLYSVTLGGAALFLCFGFIYLYEASQAADFEPIDPIPRG